MKHSLKSVALALSLAAFTITGSAKADDHYGHDDGADIFLGIIGEVLSGAIDAREARRRDREFDRYCRRLSRRCEWGRWRACRRYERHCEY